MGEAARMGGRCSRCSKKGHLAASCSAVVYCVICNSHDHMNHKCHLLKAPRPVAHAAGYAMMGLGFYHIPHPPLPRLKDSKKAQVSVEGGILSSEQLIAQLKRVVPVKWNWELKDLGEGKFLTQFPSKAELQRSIAYGGADARGEGIPQGIRLKFEEWQDKEKGFLLPKVWVRVTGIEEPLREFLILWVVGSLLGSTQSVDMETTRKNEFGRVLVAVLDPKLIPRTLDVVIGDHYFDLVFEVEKKGFDESGEEVDIFWEGGEGEGDGEGKGEEKESGADPDTFLADGQMEERENKRLKGNGSESEKGGPTDRGHVLSEEFQDFLRWKADQVFDKVVEDVLEETATNVMLEEDVPANGVAETAGGFQGIEGGEIEREVEENPEVEQRGLFSGLGNENHGLLGGEPVWGTELEGSKSCRSETRDELVDQAKLMEAALIPEVLKSPPRASPRLAGIGTEHTLLWAERRVQSRNLEDSAGNPSTDLSCSSSLANAIDNLRALGLGISNNSVNSFELNVQNLLARDLVKDRTLSEFEEGEVDLSDNESVSSEIFEKKALDYLCGELMEEVFDEDSYHLKGDLKVVQRKPGVKSSRKRASRKLKVRINKIVTT